MTAILIVFGRFLAFFMILSLHLHVFFDIALTFLCFLKFFGLKMTLFSGALVAVAAAVLKTIEKDPFLPLIRYT